ncbi:MAG TPA: O-antigen ligase family protein [Bacteroidales bacterium]|jgi:O-antigen ligase|nr:O-antigen ligase family protein [Bacteroidales bacterium]HQB52531.1 O-antigen ligase family protein [Bacteroidales bacterium]
MTGNELLILIIPAVFAILLLALLSLEYLLLLTLFLTPLSLQLSYLTGSTGFDLSLPTEPVMAFLLLTVLFRLTVTREFPKELLRHPMTWMAGLYLLWTFITALTSTIPGVSFKTLSYRLWFMAGFYLVTARLAFVERFRKRYILAYAAGLAVVVIYFIIRVQGAGLLNQQFAHSACYPFYKDHTSFGASMAFIIPPLTVMLFSRGSLWHRGFLAALLLIFVAGFVLSYSRAAWVSLIAASALSLILWTRMPVKLLSLSALLFVIVLAFSAGSIWQKMDSTTEDSSTDLGQHLRSSSNITTDQSNLERINRWKCALRMFAEKPNTGWGPGTYQFCYAPFQKPSERTAISTDFGDAGNSHSEYLGALSESGWPGALIFLAMTLCAVITGIKVWYREGRGEKGYFALAVVTGLVTYMVHGVMNSFLDSDKIAALWWGFIALIVAMDLNGLRIAGAAFCPDTRQDEE